MPGIFMKRTGSRIAMAVGAWVLLVLVMVGGAYFWVNQMSERAKLTAMIKSGPISQETSVFPSPDKTQYQMALFLDVGRSELTGSSMISTRNTAGMELNEIWVGTFPNTMKTAEGTPAPRDAYPSGFNPGWLTVQRVTVNGLPAVFEDKGAGGRIVPHRPIPPAVPIVIAMEWKARIPNAAYRFGTRNGIFMLGNFYPILSVHDGSGWHLPVNTKYGDPFYAQCADYLVRLTLPDGYEVASSGVETEKNALDNGLVTVDLQAENARDFAIAAVNGCSEQSILMDGVQMYSLTRADVKIRRQVLQAAADSLKFYNKMFGKYPYKELKLVQVPMKGFSGMEYSGIVFISDDVYKPGYGKTRRTRLAAHEVAHQWWYGMVGNDQTREPWLDEGLASWSADNFMVQEEDLPSEQLKQTGSQTMDRDLTAFKDRKQYYNAAYRDGAAFWTGLEEQLGGGEVKRLLRAYAERYKFKTATTEGLRRLIVIEAGEDIQPYFKRWFKQTEK
ncbi:MAG: M1 family metallopeptidase [Solirubrobacterales bacterium]